MSERRYEIPNLLHRMVKSDSWPIAVIYRDDEPRVEVECGRWGLNGGWVRNSYWYPKDEIPEARVIDLYATKNTPQPDGGDGALPDLPKLTHGLPYTAAGYYTADQMRKYGKQCRATRPSAAAAVPEGFVLVPTWKLRRAADIVNRDGDEHGVGADIEQMLAAAPAAPKGANDPLAAEKEDVAMLAEAYMAGHTDAADVSVEAEKIIRELAALRSGLENCNSSAEEAAARLAKRAAALATGEQS